MDVCVYVYIIEREREREGERERERGFFRAITVAYGSSQTRVRTGIHGY